MPPAMPRPPMLLSPRYMFVVSLLGLPYARNSSRHYLAFCLEISKQRMERKRTIMKLSKFRRLVSLMCVVSMMCVIVAPAAAAANYDDQISPHFISCPECRIGDMERVTISLPPRHDNHTQVGVCGAGVHYFATGSRSGWVCNRCSAELDMVYQTGHYCTGYGGHYCLDRCTC